MKKSRFTDEQIAFALKQAVVLTLYSSTAGLKNVDAIFRKQVRPTSWIDKVRKVRIVWPSFKVL